MQSQNEFQQFMFTRNFHRTRGVTQKEVGHCLDLDESRLQLR